MLSGYYYVFCRTLYVAFYKYYIMIYGGVRMSKKNTIYEITISQDGLDNYKGDNISANDIAEDLGIDSVMTDFQWDKDLKKGLILTGKILDSISVEDAFSEMQGAEYIDSVQES